MASDRVETMDRQVEALRHMPLPERSQERLVAPRLYRECTGAIECGKYLAIALSDEESTSRALTKTFGVSLKLAHVRHEQVATYCLSAPSYPNTGR
jgi:hypothetical protein